MENQKLFYLREDVFVEPLVNKWYAWANLVAPVTYSMYMVKTHKRLMQSFINNHQLHLMANKDPLLSGGGEFVDCSTEQLEDVKALLHSFETDFAIYAELADAIKDLDNLLKKHKSGVSIEPLYDQVPDLLKGYVELFMDLYHQPSYRLIEGLLYLSPFYNKSLQTVTFGILKNSVDRPFVLSTPRFISDDVVNIKASFDDSLWDKLFRTREYPISQDEIYALFEGYELEGGLNPQKLFTTDEPYLRYQAIDCDVRLHYVGHAGFLAETADSTILIDPVMAYRTDEIADKVISYSDLPPTIDYLCLTHNHSDHVNIESLLQLRYKVKTILVPKNNGGSLADPSLKLLLQNLGFHVEELEDMEKIPLKDGHILSIPFLGEHGDLNIRSKTAWYMELKGKKIYAGADSSNLEERMYKHIHAVTGDLDIMAIGMECVGAPYTWLYGALNTAVVSRKIKESRRLDGADYEKAARMVDTFSPDKVFIYALGLEPWYQYFTGISYTDDSRQIIESDKLISYCQLLDIPASRLSEKTVIDF